MFLSLIWKQFSFYFFKAAKLFTGDVGEINPKLQDLFYFEFELILLVFVPL